MVVDSEADGVRVNAGGQQTHGVLRQQPHHRLALRERAMGRRTSLSHTLYCISYQGFTKSVHFAVLLQPSKGESGLPLNIIVQTRGYSIEVLGFDGVVVVTRQP